MTPANWLQLVSIIVTLAVAVHSWMTARDRARASELADLRAAHGAHLARHDVEIAKLTERLEHVPTREEMGSLLGELRESRADVRSLRDQLGAVSARMGLHEEYLMQERSRA